MKRRIGITMVVLFASIACAIILQTLIVPKTETKAQEYSQAPETTPTYVGVEKCKNCHPGPYKAYMERKYSKSMSVIKMRGKENDPECLKCHTTGYGKPGGFVSVTATPHLESKQCESCHGPASDHVANPAQRATIGKRLREHATKTNVCTTCHICMKAHKVVAF